MLLLGIARGVEWESVGEGDEKSTGWTYAFGHFTK
jgi:hypothetical protein